MRVLCFGSDYEGDDLAFRVGRKLGLKCTSNVHDIENGDVVVDVVRGLKQVRFVKLSELKSTKALSAHDFDLGTFLRITRGFLKVKVIGLPLSYDFGKAVLEVRGLINK